MGNNSNAKQPKPILQKATHSLILGIISMILFFILTLIPALIPGFFWIPGDLAMLLFSIVFGMCAIIGLIFGIKGLKSTRGRLAIAGIAVCAISLLFWMFVFLLEVLFGLPN